MNSKCPRLIAEGRLHLGRMRYLLVAGMCAALLGLGALAGCAPAQDEDAGAGAAAEEVQEHEAVALRVAVPAELQGVVEELADAYASDKDWLTVSVNAYESAKKQNAAITPSVEAPTGEGTEADAGEALSDDAASTSGEESKPLLLPEADIVFENAPAAMDSAEKLGAVDPATRSDMLEDRLVIVASADSMLASASIANVEAGSYRLAVVTNNSVHAKRQFEVLEAVGAYKDGAYSGYYATGKDAVFECENTASLFSAVAQSDDMVALVKESDLYRFGGVKVVGSVPAAMYSVMRYPHALGMNVTLLENGPAIDEAARGFLSWAATDEDALGIITKWGFHYAV